MEVNLEYFAGHVIARRSTLWCVLLGSLLSCAFPFSAGAREARVDRGAEGVEIVRTRDYEIHFSVTGGVPVKWDLLLPAHSSGDEPGPKLGGGEERVSFIHEDLARAGVARHLELITEVTPGWAANHTKYRVNRSSDDNFETITFTSEPSPQGLSLIRSYRVPKAGLTTLVSVRFMNKGKAHIVLEQRPEDAADGPVQGPGIMLGPGLGNPKEAGVEGGSWTFTFPVLQTSDEVESLELEDGDPVDVPGPVTWAGLHNPYFLIALTSATPDSPSPITSVRARLDAPDGVEEDDQRLYPRLEVYGPSLQLAPGTESTLTFNLYVGPKDKTLLAQAGGGLEQILFHHLWGWIAALCVAFEWILGLINGVVLNWGLSILILAVILRVLLYPLSKYSHIAQRASSEKMALMKPEIAAIKERYKGNALKVSEETVKLQKEYGLNPLAQLKGSLPIMIQLPILIALYQVLSNSFEIRGVSFLWISDLSLSDRLFSFGFDVPWLGSYFNLLPVIMFAAQCAMVFQMSANTKTKQGVGLYGMPIFMLIAFYPFPAGCMLYWTMVNVAQVFEQRLTFKS
jgi:YidC/Oxa1 family membrane protein insertase